MIMVMVVFPMVFIRDAGRVRGSLVSGAPVSASWAVVDALKHSVSVHREGGCRKSLFQRNLSS